MMLEVANFVWVVGASLAGFAMISAQDYSAAGVWACVAGVGVIWRELRGLRALNEGAR